MPIRFAPKATVGDQTVIRRHMPNSVISRIGSSTLKIGNMDRSPRNVAPDLWVTERPFKLPYVRVEIGTRMTIIRLAKGGLLVHSPVKLDAELRRSIDALGETRAIIAPNKLHHLFVQDYIAAYPKARVYAAPGLPQKRPDLRFDDILSDTPQVEWRGQVEQHLFRGASPLNEVVFFHSATRTLILTDLAFNIPTETARKSPLFYMLWDVGHFGPHRFVRLRGIRDWEAARNSVERILRWDFDRIILSHGDVLDEGGREHFAGAFAFLGK
jgi:hypothetical protein